MGYSISVLRIIHDTIVDGVGFRTSVYCAGCEHRCEGCHNPDSWDINNGIKMTIEDIYREIVSNPFTNVTFTGGEPMMQGKSFYELAKLIKQNTEKTIWCYTGFLFEELKEDNQKELLRHLDVLVDGKFEKALKDPMLKFKGSSNQRTIDVKETINKGSVILWGEDL